MVTYGAVGASTAGLPKQQPIAELWQQSITQLQQQWQQPITELQQQSITELRDGRGRQCASGSSERSSSSAKPATRAASRHSSAALSSTAVIGMVHTVCGANCAAVAE